MFLIGLFSGEYFSSHADALLNILVRVFENLQTASDKILIPIAAMHNGFINYRSVM